MKRGEIWTIAGGPDYAGKPRPAVVLQDDRFEEVPFRTVCAFTSDAFEGATTRLLVQPDSGNGLRSPSRLMVDKLTTVPRSKFGRRIGQLGSDDMLRLERSVLVFLGLAGG